MAGSPIQVSSRRAQVAGGWCLVGVLWEAASSKEIQSGEGPLRDAGFVLNPKVGFRWRKENVLVLNYCQISAGRDLGILGSLVSQVTKLLQTFMCCVAWMPTLPTLGSGLICAGGSGGLAPCPGPLGLLGHPLHTLKEAEAGAQGQALHLDNTPTQGTKAHCLGPRWRGSGWEAARRLSPNPLVVGRLRSNSQSPAPAWAPGQAASRAGTLAKLGQPSPCSWPQFPLAQKRPGKQ